MLCARKPSRDNSVTALEAAEKGWRLQLELGSPGRCHLHTALPQGARYGPGVGLGQLSPQQSGKDGVEGEGPASPPLGLVTPPDVPLCKAVLFLSRVNKKKLGKHSLCCLTIS